MDCNCQWIYYAFAAFILLCFYFKHKYNYWPSRGIPTPPLLWGAGHVLHGIFYDLFTLGVMGVRQYGNVFGLYHGITPALVIADAELVKQVLVKDFQWFVNRIEVNSYHEMWNKNLFSSNDATWKRLRAICSPSFSSGKLRQMSVIMQQCVANLDRFLERLIEEKGGKAEINTKDVITGYSVDTIASTAFATEVDANHNPDNQFVRITRTLFYFSPIRMWSTVCLPAGVLKWLGIETIFPPKPFNFLVEWSRGIVRQRLTGQSVSRNDLVQLLLDASVEQTELDNVDYDRMTVMEETLYQNETHYTESSSKQKLSNSEVIANCVFFLIAGYETVTSVLSHCLYALAKNPEIQEQLFGEICQILKPGNSAPAEASEDDYLYAIMHRMPYLDAVLKETLRRYPPVTVVNRVCSKHDYQLGPVTLFKGQLVLIPIGGMHMNPQYFPDPSKFDPTRFLPQNEHEIVPGSYLPFLMGPRSCVAVRFAIQELKLCLATILCKFKFSAAPGTLSELTYKPGRNVLMSNEFPLNVEQRNTTS